VPGNTVTCTIKLYHTKSNPIKLIPKTTHILYLRYLEGTDKHKTSMPHEQVWCVASQSVLLQSLVH